MRKLLTIAALMLCATSFLEAECPTNQGLPTYPTIARAAHVSGTVELQVSVDNNGKPSVSIISGHPMLADAAKKEVENWNFPDPDGSAPKPRTFRMRFLYHMDDLQKKPEYGCTVAKIVIDFPNVEIWAMPMPLTTNYSQPKS